MLIISILDHLKRDPAGINQNFVTDSKSIYCNNQIHMVPELVTEAI